MSVPGDLWQWRSEERADRTVVILAGELDVSSADELRRRLAATIRVRPVVDVDLRGLTFIDSTILSVFIGAHQDATGAGGSLTVLNPTGHVHRVLDVTGVLPLLGPKDEPGPARAEAQ
ncbi:STAS domain-containing protein [Micromonospora soli]|uniref:STAS domain-containing protein n=1 Tax=Micromonospora sp. NBRC 110009 TaxID=3061627 RepID=UPI002671B390|nr:STAS domain-containing protein [Micromonospora sp. NBRC 110009]WKT97402.1 STAS domain-containing protein [Micromonospora sp. NBRC 110009]